MIKRALLGMLCLFGFGMNAEVLQDGETLELTGLSDSFRLDFSKVVKGTVRVSPFAESASPDASLLMDGHPVAGWSPQTPLWDSTSVEDGVHTLTLTGEDVSATLWVSNGDELVTAHGGTLAENEEWSSETAHLVGEDVLIAEESTLTIAEEASVHFLDGAGLVLQEGGTLVAAGSSAPFRVDVRETPIATGVERVSPVAESEAGGTGLQVDGADAAGWSTNAPQWNSASVADGTHVLTLKGEGATAGIEVLNGADVVVHGGVLDANETWAGGKVHVLRHAVRIPAGKTLTIADGATVRICIDTDFLVDGTLTWGNGVTVVNDNIPQHEWTYSLDENGNACITAYNGNAGNLTIPAELDGHPVVSISAGAFGTNDAITSVMLPVRMILPQENIFAGCRNLTSVTYTLDGVRMDFGQGVDVNVAGVATWERSVTLNPGWNLIAFPEGELLPESHEALRSLGGIFAYDGDSHVYFIAKDIETCRPYWIFTENELQIRVKSFVPVRGGH